MPGLASPGASVSEAPTTDKEALLLEESDGTVYVYAVREGIAFDPENPGDPFPLLDEEDLA